MIRFFFVIWGAVIATTAAASDEVPFDPVDWFAMCVSKSHSENAGDMESACFEQAANYCEVGRSYPFTIDCVRRLSNYMSDETKRWLAVLPDQLSTGSGIGKSTYKRRLTQLKAGEFATACETLPEPLCRVVEATLEWQIARGLARKSGLLNVEEN